CRGNIRKFKKFDCGALSGPFFCGDFTMPEMADFFQRQAQECRKLSAQARGKNDREYWLRLAHRWEWLLQQPTPTPELQKFPPTSIRKAISKRPSCLTCAVPLLELRPHPAYIRPRRGPICLAPR